MAWRMSRTQPAEIVLSFCETSVSNRLLSKSLSPEAVTGGIGVVLGHEGVSIAVDDIPSERVVGFLGGGQLGRMAALAAVIHRRCDAGPGHLCESPGKFGSAGQVSGSRTKCSSIRCC